jgi:CubicO group peptidase (beta-lactamase class C family)
METNELEAWLNDRAERDQFSGVATVSVGGESVFSHAAGLAHRGLVVPMQLDHRFRVASITKMVTATAVLRCVERGVFSLDTPLADLLEPGWLPAATTPALTVHHLLSHTSGLANYHDEDDDTFDSYMACWNAIAPQRAREPHDLLPLFVDKPARFAPGEGFSYGDVNYIVLGMVLAQTAGRRFAEVARTEVLDPAGMTSSGFDDLDSDPPRLAIGYRVSDGPADRWPTNSYANAVGGMPDGGLITTTDDLCCFVEAFRGDRLVSPDSRRAMLTSYGRINEGVEHYGYGMEMWMEADRATIFGHAGGDPGVSGIVSHFVDRATTVVVLCNHDRGSWPVSQRLVESIGLHDPRA